MRPGNKLPYTRSRSGVQPGLYDRKGARPYAPKFSEKEIQAGIVRAAMTYGYRVLVTSRARKATCCPSCGKWFTPHDGEGCDRGIGDLLVRNEGNAREHRRPWPGASWLMCEVKPSPEAVVRPEQQELIDAGSMVLAFTSDDLLRELERIEAWMDGRSDGT